MGSYYRKQLLVRLLLFLAGVFLDILKKFFPSGRLSLGAQKLFAGRYRAADCSALLVAAVWIGFNLIFFVLYRQGIIGVPELMLLTLFYFLSDMVCVLYFCLFRLMMHTRCCTTCRIFNWDSMMMCTSLLFIGGIYGWSLAAFAMAVLIHWETLYSRFPERFFECSNRSLRCGNCEGNLCRGRLKRRCRAIRAGYRISERANGKDSSQILRIRPVWDGRAVFFTQVP